MPKTIRQAGFSLIEAVVAVSVVSITVLAAFNTVAHSERVIGQALPRILANSVALNQAGLLRVLPARMAAELPEAAQNGPYTWRIERQVIGQSGPWTEMAITVTGNAHAGASTHVLLLRPDP